MRAIIAIGGGEIGRPGTKIETLNIDREIVRLSNKKHPKVLFLPTASGDSESYYGVVKNYFGKKLGCSTDVLYLTKHPLTIAEISKKIFSADIIYVGGGNTLQMMQLWRKTGTDKILKKAYEKGIILSGVSAGAICWFSFGNSDSLYFSNKNTNIPLIKVKGLALIKGLACPHYNFEKERKASLKKMLRKSGGIGIALDNCSALEIIDNTYRILNSKKGANVYKAFWDNKKYKEKIINPQKKFAPLTELYNKK